MFWLLLCYFIWRSSAGCMYSEKSVICDILPNLVVYLSHSHENVFSVFDNAYCTVGSNGW